MQRNNRNNQNKTRRSKPMLRRNTNSRNLNAQNAAGVSHRDFVRAVRKFMVFNTLPINNANSEYSYGLVNFNISGLGTPLSDLLDDYGRVYEQYRIRRVIIRCTPGRGMTNDLRLQTYVSARVDVDQQPLTATISSLKSLINAENSVTKTFVERGNIKLCDFKPQCRVNTTASLPVLPNQLNWYPIQDYNTHVWRGSTVGAFLPSDSFTPGQLTVTLSAEVDVEFRGRVTSPTLFTSEHFNQDAPPVIPDLSGSLEELKNKFLTGAYFPLEAYSFNVANIGTSVTADEILDAKFRDQSTTKTYYISQYSLESQTYEAMEYM